MSEMLKMAERCERLEGPSDEVDLAIATWCYRNGAIAGVNYDPVLWVERHGGEFTGCLDAAMTLVPEGLRLMLSEWDDEKHLRSKGPWQAVLCEPGSDASFDLMRGYRCDHAATPALAICAAALRARHHLENSDAQG